MRVAVRVFCSTAVIVAGSIGALAACAKRTATPPTPSTLAPANRLAVVAPGQKGPAYPDSLKTARAEGSVVIQFVVDSSGSAMLPTLKVLTSDHPQFTGAVRDGLASLRFLPAEVNGRRVRQLAQQRYDFRMNGAQGFAVVMSPVTMPTPVR